MCVYCFVWSTDPQLESLPYRDLPWQIVDNKTPISEGNLIHTKNAKQVEKNHTSRPCCFHIDATSIRHTKEVSIKPNQIWVRNSHWKVTQRRHKSSFPIPHLTQLFICTPLYVSISLSSLTHSIKLISMGERSQETRFIVQLVGTTGKVARDWGEGAMVLAWRIKPQESSDTVFR